MRTPRRRRAELAVDALALGAAALCVLLPTTATVRVVAGAVAALLLCRAALAWRSR